MWLILKVLWYLVLFLTSKVVDIVHMPLLPACGSRLVAAPVGNFELLILPVESGIPMGNDDIWRRVYCVAVPSWAIVYRECCVCTLFAHSVCTHS